MSENIKKFLELVSKDEALKKKVFAFNDLGKEEAIRASIALAKELGIELTEADFVVKEADKELTEDELTAVAGGDCMCGLGGAGGGTDSRDHKTYGCACVLYGQGGDGSTDDFNCMCPLMGVGNDDSNWNWLTM